MIEVEGEAHAIDAFARTIPLQAPPISRVDHVAMTVLPPIGYVAFAVQESQDLDGTFALVSPDLCVCEDCLREMREPSDRRYRYPFINCTNRGPRVWLARGGVWECESGRAGDATPAPLNGLVRAMLRASDGVRVLRDPTRGGLATTLNEIAAASKHSIQIDEAAVPVRPAVQAACELLGPSSLLSPRLAGSLGGERPCFWSETWCRVLRWR